MLKGFVSASVHGLPAPVAQATMPHNQRRPAVVLGGTPGAQPPHQTGGAAAQARGSRRHRGDHPRRLRSTDCRAPVAAAAVVQVLHHRPLVALLRALQGQLGAALCRRHRDLVRSRLVRSQCSLVRLAFCHQHRPPVRTCLPCQQLHRLPVELPPHSRHQSTVQARQCALCPQHHHDPHWAGYMTAVAPALAVGARLCRPIHERAAPSLRPGELRLQRQCHHHLPLAMRHCRCRANSSRR